LKLDKRAFGLARTAVFRHQVFSGFILGIITLLPILMILSLLNINIVDTARVWTVGLAIKKAGLSLFLAFIVALIEEPLFRGLLLGGLSQKMPIKAAIFISAFYYAALHFLSSPVSVAYPNLHWWSGLTLIPGAFANIFKAENLSALAALFAVGVFLGVVRAKISNGLGICIGCHAAWVWQIKLNKSIFNTDFSHPYHFLVSHYDGIIGPLVTVWLLAAAFFFWRKFLPPDMLKIKSAA
jgi:membrane protease YdiL (CAAX protease family)